MIAMIIVFVILLFAGMPIAFALGIGGIVGLLWMQVDLVVAAARMFTGIDSFVLLAVPFFILSGEIMSRGGITERLVRHAAEALEVTQMVLRSRRGLLMETLRDAEIMADALDAVWDRLDAILQTVM